MLDRTIVVVVVAACLVTHILVASLLRTTSATLFLQALTDLTLYVLGFLRFCV